MYSTSESSAVATNLEAQPLDLVSHILALLRWHAADLAALDVESHQGPRRKVQFWQIVVGIDGTTWSVCNTPQHLARIVKAKTRRGCAAFAKTARARWWNSARTRRCTPPSSWTARASMCSAPAHLSRPILLILDRLYSQAPLLAQLQQQCSARKEQHYLVRVCAKLGVSH